MLPIETHRRKPCHALLVIEEVAQREEEEALRGTGNPGVAIQQKAHERRPGSVHTHDEDRLHALMALSGYNNHTLRTTQFYDSLSHNPS